MRTRVISRSFQIFSLVAVLALLAAVPVLAEEPLDLTIEPAVEEFERLPDGGQCGWLYNLIWGARANCPDRGGLVLWLGL